MTSKHAARAESFDASLGHHLTKAIEARGATVRDVATAAGIPEARLNRILAGRTSSKITELLRICVAVDAHPGEVVGLAERGIALP